jgi:DNA-binding NtrC family response regulator
MIAAGTFREDLFYRLNVIHLRVPALRERREDIPALVQHFMTVYGNQNGHGHSNGNGSLVSTGNGQGTNGNHRHGSVVKSISTDALNMLTAYHWPGNVRELENVIERLTVTGRSVDITPQDLPHEILHFQSIHHAPRKERRRTVADDLYKKLVDERQSFWVAVYPLYMQREITKQNVRARSQGPRGGTRQLQDRRPALQPGSGRLQAFLELPPEARLPASLQGIPAVALLAPYVRSILRTH